MDHCRNSIRRSDGETAVGVGWIEWLGGGDDPPRPRENISDRVRHLQVGNSTDSMKLKVRYVVESGPTLERKEDDYGQGSD